jgi:hypothetical protein
MRTPTRPTGVFITPDKNAGVLKGKIIYTMKTTSAVISKEDNDFAKS